MGRSNGVAMRLTTKSTGNTTNKNIEISQFQFGKFICILKPIIDSGVLILRLVERTTFEHVKITINITRFVCF